MLAARPRTAGCAGPALPVGCCNMRVEKILFWPYQIYVWLVFLPLVVLLTLLFSMLTVLFATLVNPRFASRTFARSWARILAWLTPIRVIIEGAGNLPPEGQKQGSEAPSYVVVVNHQSQYDILVVYGWLNLDLKWVMKKELRKIPGIGIGCEKAGHVFVDRRDTRQATAAIAEALSDVEDGVGLLFFPEGTRSPDGRLLRFKKGAFRTAIEQQIPLLPITLIGTRDILPAHSLRLFPGTARMVIHPPIETRGMSLQELPELMEVARAAIARSLPAELQ